MERNRDHPDPDRVGTIYVRGESRDDIKQYIGPAFRYVHEELNAEWLTPDHARAAGNHAETGSAMQAYVAVEDRMNPDSGEVRFNFDDLQGDPNRPGLGDARKYLRRTTANHLVVPTVRMLIDHRHDSSELTELINAGVTVHVVEQGLTVTGTCDETEDILLAAAAHDDRSRPGDVEELETENEGTETTQILVRRAEYRGGRPPFGFEVGASGDVVAKPEYDRICEVVQRVKDGVYSKATAADKLDCARSTIGNCLDRPELYQLE